VARRGNRTRVGFGPVGRLRLGTLAWIAGFVADASKPGGIAPVWTSAETLRITALGIESGGSQDQLTEQTIAVRPEAAKPDHLVCWDVYPSEPCSNTFQYWTGYWSYADGTKTIGNPLETKLRVGPMQLYNAYFLYDSYGNLTYAPEASTSATQPPPNVTVGFSNQVSTGPDFAGYALSTSWHNDPQMPQGQMQSTLTVCYPTDAGPTPDWQAGSVSKTITYQFDTGSTKLLAQKQSYEARFGMEDGLFPLEVSPEAGSGGLPTSAAGDTPRLVLLALNGTLVKTELLEGAVEPSLEPQKVWKKDGAVWSYTDDQDQSTVIETSDQPQFRLSLVDGDGAVVPEGELQAHLCPRYEHFTEGPTPPGQCTASPIAAGPGTGRIDSLTLNQPGAQRGYLGIELTKAPPKQGEYYIKVESLGPSLYRMRRQGQLTLDTHATGEHVGYFAICIVSGGEFLDGDFRRVSQVDSVVPKPMFLRITTNEEGPSLSAVVDTLREDRTLFQRSSPMTLARIGQSNAYLAGFTVVPEGYSSGEPLPDPTVGIPFSHGRLVARLEEPTAALSESASRSRGESPPQAEAGSLIRSKLVMRFLDRTGTALTPPPAGDAKDSGTVQQTEITWEEEPNFNAIENVWVEIRAENPNDWTRLRPGTVEVAVIEEADERFHTDTATFYTGAGGGTNLSAGKVDGLYLRVENGSMKLPLRSCAIARKDKSGALINPQYNGANAALLTLATTKQLGHIVDDFLPTGEPFRVGHWVDERSYARRPTEADKSKGWVDTGNGISDWLERKFWDTLVIYANPAGSESESVAQSPQSLVQELIDGPPGGFCDGQTVHLNAADPMIRLNWRSNTIWHYYQGLRYHDSWDTFQQVTMHEARHAWQHRLTSLGFTDADGDTLVAVKFGMPDSLGDLIDGPNRAVDPQGNIDGHFLGDGGGAASKDTQGQAVIEHNAQRFANELGLLTDLGCALTSYSILDGADQTAPPGALLSAPLTVAVKSVSYSGEGDQPQGAVTIHFFITAGDARIDGQVERFVMTDEMGRAQVQLTNGTRDSEIAAEIVPWPLPNPVCESLAANRVTAYARVAK
jgi:hypothetical protein